MDNQDVARELLKLAKAVAAGDLIAKEQAVAVKNFTVTNTQGKKLYIKKGEKISRVLRMKDKVTVDTEKFFSVVLTPEEAKKNLKLAKQLTADDEPYAAIVVNRNSIGFRIAPSGSTGRQPYRNNAPKAIRYVLDLVKKYGVDDKNVEIITGK
jgi:hypothetical protein